MPPFTIAHVVPTDLSAINDIDVRAFNNPRTLAYRVFTHQSDEEVAWRLARTVQDYNSSDDSRWDKLVDNATGKVIAFATWQEPRKNGSQEEEQARQSEKGKAEKEFKEATKFPKGANERLLDDFVKATRVVREKHVDTERDYSKLLRLSEVIALSFSFFSSSFSISLSCACFYKNKAYVAKLSNFSQCCLNIKVKGVQGCSSSTDLIL